MEMKQTETFFHGTYSNLSNISMTFLTDIFQFHCKNEHKQVKSNKIKQSICKSDSIFSCLQSRTSFQGLLKFIS